MPNSREVEDVLLVVCNKAGLNPDGVNFSIAGGDRKRLFGQRGVKLMSVSSQSMGVPMYVGCLRDAVEGFLVYNNGMGSMKAGEVYAKLYAAFGNSRIHHVDDRRIQAARATSTPATEKTTPSAIPMPATTPVNVAPPELPGNNSGQGAVEEPPQTPPAPSVSAKATLGELPKEDKSPPDSLGNNDRNLHLAIIAFAERFKLNQPFSFSQFEGAILKDVGIACPHGGTKPFIRVFTSAGFIQRLNPNGTPARYAITELCVEIAKANDADALQLIVEHRNPIEEQAKKKPQETEKPPVDLLAQIQELRRREEEYQNLLRNTDARSSEITKLESRNLSQEETDIEGQIKSLSKRLSDLREALSEIGKTRQKISQVREELERAQEELKEGSLAEAHEQFMKLKSALG